MGQVQQSANGIMVRDERGRFLPGTMPSNTITPANAREYQHRRYDLAKQAAARGLLDGVNRSGVVNVRDTPVEAWGEIVGHAAELVMVSDNTRGVAELSRFVGQAADMIPDSKRADDSVLAVAASVGAAVVAGLLSRLVDLVGDGDSVVDVEG
jgi:hypothetical protein